MYRVFDSSILYIFFWSLFGVDVSFRHLDNSALFNVTYRAKKGHFKSEMMAHVSLHWAYEDNVKGVNSSDLPCFKITSKNECDSFVLILSFTFNWQKPA